MILHEVAETVGMVRAVKATATKAPAQETAPRVQEQVATKVGWDLVAKLQPWPTLHKSMPKLR